MTVVLVTGASGGIGRAIAIAFAKRDASVAVHYHRGREAAEGTLALMKQGPHYLVAADVSDPGDAEKLFSEVVAKFGRVDVLVNNAAIAEQHPPLGSDFAGWQGAWERHIDANLVGPANLCYFAARQMARQRSGRIINISSRGAFRGEPDMPAYGATKAGINSMSQSLAVAMAPHQVYVYAVAPGWVDTDRVAPKLSGERGEAILRESPLGRVATPEEVANTVVFLASPGSESLTGSIIDVNGASYLR